MTVTCWIYMSCLSYSLCAIHYFEVSALIAEVLCYLPTFFHFNAYLHVTEFLTKKDVCFESPDVMWKNVQAQI